MRTTYENELAKYFISERQHAGRGISTLDLLLELDRLNSMKGQEILDLLQVSRGQRWRILKRLVYVEVITQYREPGFMGRGLNVKLTDRGRKIVELIKTWKPNLTVKTLKKLKFPEVRGKEIEPEDFYKDSYEQPNDEIEEIGLINVEESGLTEKQRFELEQFLNELECEEEE